MSANVHLAVRKGDTARLARSFHTAEQYYWEALHAAETAISEHQVDSSHLDVAHVWVKLARLFETTARLDASERAYQHALQIFSQVGGDEYFDLAIARDRVDVPDLQAA